MTDGPDAEKPETKLQQFADGAADSVLHEVLGAAVEVTGRALSGTADVASCAAEIAADCGSVVVDAACTVAGSMLDGV